MAQYVKGRSTITGRKTRLHKKMRRKKPVNYINAIKLVAGGGTASYLGDLCDGGDCIRVSAHASLGISYRISESVSVRAEGMWVRLSGLDKEDSPNAGRNLSFRGDNFEFNAIGIYDIFEQHKMYRRRHFINPYVFAGVGLLLYNPTAELNGERYKLKDFDTEGVDYSGVTFLIPYGAGFRFAISPQVNVGLEFTWRKTFTDYIDDVSDTYDPNFLGQSKEGNTKLLLSDRRGDSRPYGDRNDDGVADKRGNPDRDDSYFTVGVRLDYTIKVTRQHYNINSHRSRFRIIKSLKTKR